jgi:hypothetical protein
VPGVAWLAMVQSHAMTTTAVIATAVTAMIVHDHAGMGRQSGLARSVDRRARRSAGSFMPVIVSWIRSSCHGSDKPYFDCRPALPRRFRSSVAAAPLRSGSACPRMTWADSTATVTGTPATLARRHPSTLRLLS